ncbi:MAG: hypothetical protein JWO03_2138 [Bacteroidetes bacterium]|nr:hypothetical protein [Bacteroidota bacterium]
MRVKPGSLSVCSETMYDLYRIQNKKPVVKMKNYYINQAKPISAIARICLSVILTLLLAVSAIQSSSAQCSTCTNGTTSTNSSITVSAGQFKCLTFSGTYTGTITVNGGTLCISSATNWNGATISISGSGTINNYGTSNKSFTLLNGFTFNNNGLYSGTLTQNAGSICTNNATFSGPLVLSGTFTNNNILSGATTVNAGSTFTNNGTVSSTVTQAGGTATNNSSFTGALVQNGGIFTNSTGATMSNTVSIKSTFSNQGTLSNAVTVTTGGQLTNNNAITGSLIINSATGNVDNYGNVTSAFTQSLGTFENFTGATFAPSGTPTFTSGTLTNDAGATATLGSMTIKNGFIFNNYGDMTATSVANQVGGIINFAGTSQVINGSVNNQSTITLDGALTITGTYTDGTALVPSTIKAVGSGANCNLLQIGAITNATSVGTFDGNGKGLTLTSAVPSTGGRMINGATGPVTAPGIQGSALSVPVSGLTVSGSFTAPAGANGYLVLRYIGGSAPSDNPVNNTLYAVGNTIGTSTVEAVLTGAAGAKSFTDILPASSCGQNVYYTVFSFNGTQPCEIFNLASPLTANITMTVPTVTITPGGPTTFCTPSSVVLTASGSAGSYLWSTTATTAAITASSTANYTVTVTSAQGCTASDVEPVTANITPSPVITPSGATTICTPATVTLTASGGGTYLWSTGATTAAIIVNSTGTYTVTVTSAVGGCTASASQSVTVNTTPTASVTPSGPTTFCSGGSVDLTAAGGGTYVWSNGGATTATITATTSATYTVTVTNPVGGCTASASRAVTVNALPSPVITPSGPTTICTPATVTLTASGGGTYSWSTGASTAAITVGSTGTYTVTVTNAALCTASASRSVTVNTTPTPVITPSGPTTFCAGGSVTLTASGGGTYTWSTGATTAAISATTSGTYTVTVTGAVGGCTASVNRSVTVNANPTPSSTNATSCFSATATITASGGGTYAWSTGASTASITQSPASTTTYTVTVTNAALCTAAASGTITVSNPAPTTTNPAVCAGTIATMTATGGGTYVWSTGSTTDTICSLTAGVYSVTVTNPLGCTATATGIITVNALPAPSATNADLCPGGTATITASGGSIYTWSSGETTASITKSVAGTYTVTATNMGSCTATASGTITAVANPTASATNGVTCSGVPAVITASGGTGYLWSTTETTASISVTTIGTYTVTVSNASGCTATASSSVTAAALPTPGITNPTPTRCVGQSATLTGTGGVSYTWSTGALTASITQSPASTTTYTVTVRNAGGCSASASTTVTVNALPTPSATGGVICTGTPTSPAVLTASGGTSYLWSNGTATANNSVVAAGTYTVTVTNAATCTATASAVATTAAKPTATATTGAACLGTSITLTAGGGTSYTWSTGATTPSITVSPAATTYYNVVVSNASGCFVVKADTATVYPLPTAAPSSNSPVMLSTPINLTSNPAAGTPGYTYSWTGPSAMTSVAANPIIASAAVSNGGIYYLTVTDSKGCTATGNTAVVLNYAAPGGLGSNTALWLYGDSVIATGTTVTGWYDASQLNNDVTGINGTAPTLVAAGLNAHPAVNFIGTGGLRGTFLSPITSTNVSAFVVSKANSTSPLSAGIFSIAATGAIDSNNTTSANLFARGSGAIYSQRNSTVEGGYTSANALDNYHMSSSIFAATKDSFFVEGRAQTLGTYAAAAFGSSRYTVGERIGAATFGSYLNGQVAEIALFNRQVTNAERSQIESYLAIKYGFTLDQTTPQNYIESNGTIYWNAATNGAYKNNIFGVGKEPVTALSQIQSVSINTSILSINSASGLTAYSYLVVSDDAGANSVSAAVGLPNSINAKLARKWRVSQTGTRTAANYVFDRVSTAFGFYAPIAASMTPYLLIDSDANGVYETYKALSSTSGTTTTFNANLKDGCIFTIGYKANIDYGDAMYVATTNAAGGAAHMIVAGVYLGSLIDGELDAVPSVNAAGDDTIGVADEDGVTFNPGVPTSVNIVTMGSNSITVVASTAGYLNVWADFNQDGTYGGGSEYAIQNIPLVAGSNTVTFSVSDSVQYGPTSMRFRFATGIADVTAATGLATNGEVEDYEIYVTAPLVAACTNGFQNPGFEMGPAPGTYIITDDWNLPYWRTNATDGKIEVWQSGFNGTPSHGGTYFVELEANLFGSLYQDVYTTPGTILKWSFSHRGRSGSDTAEMRIGTPQSTVLQRTVIDGNTAWGTHTGFYTVPAGQYITRLEFVAVGSYGGNNSIGNFLDDVSVGSSFDYGDAPNSYGTLIASGGPYHSSTGTLYLGAGVTCDADGQPNATANADAMDDGISFPVVCANCNTYTVSITAFNNTGALATVAGWIDFNKNGVFEASERKSVNVPSSAISQVVSMTFTVSTFSASQTYTFARFRIANDSTELATPGGMAKSGEVEDYKIPCVGVPTPVPTATPTPVCARGPMTLNATGTAPSYSWTGPNGYTSAVQNPTVASVGYADSGYYRVYAVYANGCETDSAVRVVVSNCLVNLTGNLLDDANGNGVKDGVEITSNRGQTVYAILSSSGNIVLDKSVAAANGAFTFNSVPAYTTGMVITPSTTNPSIGAATPAVSWPTNWVGTKSQYGTNNNAGTGTYSTANQIPVSVDIKNLSNLLLGYDQLPASSPRSYTIAKPHLNSTKSITPANGLGMFGGSDPEDGTFGAGSTFTITSLTGLNGNRLFYDANGDGIQQAYEEITGYTVITNVDPTKFIIRFNGIASNTMTFNYATTDAAGKVDPAPTTYTLNWTGTLPVQLLSFTGEKYNETTKLDWSTASEINNDHFDIERSTDGSNWEKIGEVKGNGNTNERIDYSMVDENPVTGANYYRLKQVDFDGKFEYSNIVVVDFGTEQNHAAVTTVMNIYPNPLNSGKGLNVSLKGSDDNIKQIAITNEMGQVVYNTEAQDAHYEIQGLDLPAGIYMVHIVSQANATFTGKIIVTK